MNKEDRTRRPRESELSDDLPPMSIRKQIARKARAQADRKEVVVDNAVCGLVGVDTISEQRGR